MGVKFSGPVQRQNLYLNYKKKIPSTDVAMVLLKFQHKKRIQHGRKIARMIALEYGEVTSRDMVAAMIAEGSLVAGEEDEHWVSAVFRHRMWEWTGRWAFGKATKTQGGVRSVKIWKLRGT